jgi:hypothetical protein
MIQRLLANIDALGDRIHPIIVLMLRKQRFWKSWCPVVVGTHLLLFVIVYFNEAFVRYFDHQISFVGMMYLKFFLIMPFIASTGFAVNGYYFVQKSDPLLLLIPISDRSIWFGFYLTGLYHGVSAWCYVVLMLSYCYVLKWVPLEWVLLYPLLSLFAGCLFNALVISMSVAAKTVVHRYFVFPIWFFPTWCLMMLCIEPPQIRSLILAPFPSSLFEPACFLPVLAVAVPVYLLAAWKLFHFNLPRRRSFLVKYCVSLLVYLTLTALLGCFWYCLFRLGW